MTAATMLAPCTPRESDVLVFRFVAGLTQSETAQVLGCSRQNVFTTERRAVEKMRAAYPEPPSPSAATPLPSAVAFIADVIEITMTAAPNEDPAPPPSAADLAVLTGGTRNGARDYGGPGPALDRWELAELSRRGIKELAERHYEASALERYTADVDKPPAIRDPNHEQGPTPMLTCPRCGTPMTMTTISEGQPTEVPPSDRLRELAAELGLDEPTITTAQVNRVLFTCEACAS